MVEFALCLIPLLLIMGGIVDFGQAWYMESVLATASREGARYATRYKTTPNGMRLAPNTLGVVAYIKTNYTPTFPQRCPI